MKELKMFNQPAPMDTSQLDLAVGPHCRMSSGLAEIYQLWVIALTPAMAASLFIMGPASLRVFGLCVCFSVIIDFICEKLAPSRDLTSNWSSVSLALLLAFMLPLNAPWWFILIGCLIMIVIGKKFFGGVGAYQQFAAGKAMMGAGEGMAQGGGGGGGGGRGGDRGRTRGRVVVGGRRRGARPTS